MRSTCRAIAIVLIGVAFPCFLLVRHGAKLEPRCEVVSASVTNAGGTQLGLFALKNTGPCAVEVDIYGMYHKHMRPDYGGVSQMRDSPSFGVLQPGAMITRLVGHPGPLNGASTIDAEWRLECRYRRAQHIVEKRLRQGHEWIWQRFPSRISAPSDKRRIFTVYSAWIQ